MTSQRAIFPEPHIEGHTSSKADQGQEENDGVLMKVPKGKASNTSDCETVRAFEPVESCGVQVVKNTSHPRMRKLKPFLQEQTATTGNGNKRPDPANPLCWRCLLLLEKRFWMLGSGGDRCFLVGKNSLFSRFDCIHCKPQRLPGFNSGPSARNNTTPSGQTSV